MDRQPHPTKIVDFHYKFKNFDDTTASLIYPIEVPFRGSPKELAHCIITERMDPIMKFLLADKDLKLALELFIEEENQKFYDEHDDALIENLQSGHVDVDALSLDLEKLYKDEILEYAERIGPSDEEIFAQSYHQLVHSSVLSEILAKEREYAKVITNLMAQMTQQINTMNTLHHEEIESKMKLLDISVTSENINHILAKQYGMQNMIRRQCESELASTRGHQKYEYRNWITTHIDENFLAESDSPTQIGNRWSMISTQGPSMEESFTIHLGSQLKHMHNIRILSTKMSDLCSPLYSDSSFGGPNVALGLYSSSLCGIVVLTSSGNIAPDSEIRRNANMSTEFHFDQIDHQIEKIQDDLRRVSSFSEEQDPEAGSKTDRNSSRLKPGDVYITRHSNLSHSHVIFHLISDETFQSPSEINSRHPVILGLRNILKISSRHDVTTLTIPALLRNEMSEDMTVNWCMRRAELVFKCAKGFMIESASWGGAELNTLQLLLPHDISEELFRTLADMVPHVFRVANPKVLQ
ncbi:protein C12orf4 homolog [Toxorhynchites rutilus septentrionalis]|uniref:protein C12orf4 homolog n=1 Tax=Toxorhynchites rutilus septentrionalis TaxID=329112 RepID=UPI00247A209F|nr:protein C12orf4 homolog [Toxorhynchites rutilus septentrionalis]XP_055617575.1 protein C12orf4 homolog [Toxorhynchites rutilus septentrionalis]